VRALARSATRARRARGPGPAGGGELAGDLLSAAATLIAERGPRGFSLREVARRARVSEAAPYWHFPGKEALLAAVAAQGFGALAAAMAEVRQRVKDPRRQLQAVGVAYVRFALAHPSHLRIMFGPEIGDKVAHPSLGAASERAFDLLVATIVEGQHARHIRGGDPRDLAVSAWALVHGLSALLVDRRLEARAPTALEAERLAARVTKLLLTGLARP
jgi:AcrR family transcriptional regulator